MESGSFLLGLAAICGAGSAIPSLRRLPAALQLALLSGSVALFARALLVVDGRYAEVADTASRATSWPYRLAGLWGGPRSSMLMFTWCVALVTAVAVEHRQGGRTAAILRALIISALCTVTLLFANPFKVLDVPAVDGGGLTPILRHPAMLIHPPLLYVGLTLCIAAAINELTHVGRNNTVADTHGVADNNSVADNKAALAAWSILAFALALGSWWAYAELGWGGVWGWDPIENAGLLPWLLLTASVHLRRGGSPRAARILVVCAGWFALAGTVLTRSGAGQSVHAFADARQLGRALAAVLLVAAVGASLLLARHRGEPVRLETKSPIATTAAVLSGLAAIVVVVGTAAPLVADLFGRDAFSVEGFFFARLLLPIALAALVLVGLGSRPSRTRILVGGGSMISALVVGEALWPWWCALLLATSMLAATLIVPARSTAMMVAHAGFVLLLGGVAMSSTGTSATVGLRPGRDVVVQRHRVRFVRLEHRTDDPQRDRIVAVLELTGSGSPQFLRPSLDRWVGTSAPLAESATASPRWVDLQVVLRRVIRNTQTPDSAIVIDIHVRPLIRLVWWGAALMGLGALLAMVRRRRVTARIVK